MRLFLTHNHTNERLINGHTELYLMVVIFAFQSNTPGTFRLFASISMGLEATCVTRHPFLQNVCELDWLP